MWFCFAGGILQWILAVVHICWLNPGNVMLFNMEMCAGWVLVGMGFIIQEIRQGRKDR